MVDIAQLVSASDCGSEGRGFESHYPPQKKEPVQKDWFFFLATGDNGIRMAQATLSCCFAAIHLEPGPGAAGVKNSPGDCFSGRGRIPGALTASRRGVGNAPALFAPDTQKGVFFYGDNGIRMAQATLSCCFAAIHLEAVKKTCRGHVFRPWENPRGDDGSP